MKLLINGKRWPKAFHNEGHLLASCFPAAPSAFAPLFSFRFDELAIAFTSFGRTLGALPFGRSLALFLTKPSKFFLFAVPKRIGSAFTRRFIQDIDAAYRVFFSDIPLDRFRTACYLIGHTSCGVLKGLQQT